MNLEVWRSSSCINWSAWLLLRLLNPFKFCSVISGLSSGKSLLWPEKASLVAETREAFFFDFIADGWIVDWNNGKTYCLVIRSENFSLILIYFDLDWSRLVFWAKLSFPINGFARSAVDYGNVLILFYAKESCIKCIQKGKYKLCSKNIFIYNFTSFRSCKMSEMPMFPSYFLISLLEKFF